MRVELFGVARARAGTEAVTVEASSLAEAIVALAAACPGLVPEVIADDRLADGFLASLNGEQFVRDGGLALDAGDTLLILGAQVGG